MPTVLPGTRLYEGYLPALVREVDTYFHSVSSLTRQKITQDEALINHFPDIFSSFYNLPCRALPLAALHQIVSFFRW